MAPVKDSFTYLGYFFQVPKLSIRQSTVNGYIQSIAAFITDYVHNKNSKLRKYPNLTQEQLLSIFGEELNDRISGAIAGKRRYGWISYYSQINDLSVLFKMDKIIQGIVNRHSDFDPEFVSNMKKLSRAFHETKFRPNSGYIRNFDAYDSLQKKLGFLKSRGRISDKEQLKRVEIEDRFFAYQNWAIAQMQSDEGRMY